jgi:AcrR family transcriptional regulator
MGIREDQREKRYWEILSAALDLFIRKGYHATKISDITKAVGMSTGLLFHYFNSKEELYEELIRIGISGPTGVLPTEESDPIFYLENTAETIISSLKKNSFAAKMFLLMGQAYYMESVSEDIKLRLMELDIYTSTVALMKRGQQKGVIREGDPYAMSIAYWCSVQGICEQLAILPDAPCPKGEWIADMFRKR